MIVVKTWERLTSARTNRLNSHMETYLDTYTGWFLLGFIPLFISRSRERK